LIGSEVQLSQHVTSTVGLNFKVIVSRDTGTERATSTRIENLLPEVLVDAFKEEVPEHARTLDDVRSRLVAGAANGFRPGTPLLIHEATLGPLPGHADDEVLAGEMCAPGRIESGSYFLRSYFMAQHRDMMSQLAGQPVSILGVMRWTPSYEIPGASAANLAMRVASVWLR
jgi:hypothetical protein